MRRGTRDREVGVRRGFMVGVVATALVLAAGGAVAGDWSNFHTRQTTTLDRPILPDNGYHDVVLFATNTLEPGGGWVSFTWEDRGDGARLVAKQGPFEFSSAEPVMLRITDDFCGGDEFRVYDNGVEVGMTFWVAPLFNEDPLGEAIAFDTSWLASGIFNLPAGDHSIEIEITENPWTRGRGYVRVDNARPMTALNLDDVATTYATIHGQDRFYFMAQMIPGEDSDGVFPSFEETVLWYGKYLEVVEPGEFVCDTTQCVYENDGGPGITRAIIMADGTVLFEGRSVDLCPGGNPYSIGVWLGDEGATAPVRCKGTLNNNNP